MQISFLLLLASVSLVACHTNMISINGIKNCVRSFPNNSPVENIRSDLMKCYGSDSPAPSRCSFSAGQTVTLKWYHNDAEAVAPSHKGPICVYLAAASTKGNGAAWFKIAERGYSNGRWAVDELVAKNGKWEVTIPKNLKPGNYILRTELLALHSAQNTNGAQFYVGCADITVTGNGKADCSPKVAIPGNQWVPNAEDSSVKLSIYWPPLTKYKIPGPAVATCKA